MDWHIFSSSMFGEYKQDWDQLNSDAGNSPLLDSRFVIPLLENFGLGDEKLAICMDNDRPCCMAIIVKTGLGRWQTFQPSQAPIGCWVQNPDASIENLGKSLRKSLPGFILLFGITQQDPSLLARPNNSKDLNTIDYIETARVAVQGSFDQYWSNRGKNLRQNLRRQRNRLSREKVDVKLKIICDAHSMYDAVSQYGEMESKGWKSESNSAIHIDNSQGKFYTSMLESFSETGQAFVFQYFYDDVLSATDLCIIGGGSLVILKTTYDESISTSSPAMLMREDTFNRIFSEKIAERIEFYGRVMDWHKRWSDDIRTMYHINFLSKSGGLIRLLRSDRKFNGEPAPGTPPH